MTTEELIAVVHNVGGYLCTAAEGALGVRGYSVGQVAVIQKMMPRKGTIDLARYRYQGDGQWELTEN